MALPKRTRKKTVRARRRTGAGGAPVEKGFDSVLYYFQNEIDTKESINLVKSFIKSEFNKTDAKNILAHPDNTFGHRYMGATAFWYLNGHEVTDRSEYWKNACIQRFKGFIDQGKAILKEKALEKKVANNIVSLSPVQRLQRKIGNTIMQDMLDLEDQWMEGQKATIDLYALFKKYGLSNSATIPVRDVIEGWLLDYEDAYHKRCEQAVEGYSHLKRPELNRRIKVCNQILEDLVKVKAAAKAGRTIRIKKPISVEKQVRSVKYKKECKDYKLVSISPVQIIGKKRFYAFNTKYKTIMEYVTEAPKGFEIGGTSIKNFDKEQSRSVKLRKPDDFLPTIMNKTPNQINVAWKTLTTKTGKPNGRINADTLLLRVLDR